MFVGFFWTDSCRFCRVGGSVWIPVQKSVNTVCGHQKTNNGYKENNIGGKDYLHGEFANYLLKPRIL